MLIFSFDCAVRNLGVVVVKTNENFHSQLTSAWAEAKKYTSVDELVVSMGKINSILDSKFNILHADSYDVGDKSTKKINTQILQNLKLLQQKLIDKWGHPDYVLIEYQMCINVTSHSIQDALHMYYTPLPGDSHVVHIVHPSLKGTVSLAPHLTLDNFASINNYRSNKKHSTANYNEFCRVFGLQPNKKKRDDIADALLQALAWCSVHM
jgi:hypothetical protein